MYVVEHAVEISETLQGLHFPSRIVFILRSGTSVIVQAVSTLKQSKFIYQGYGIAESGPSACVAEFVQRVIIEIGRDTYWMQEANTRRLSHNLHCFFQVGVEITLVGTLSSRVSKFDRIAVFWSSHLS